MSIFSKISEATKDLASGAHGFAKGLLDGTTKGNSIGSLVGIVAGVGVGIATGGLIPAIALGVGLGAACGIAGGAVVGSINGAVKSGRTIKNLDELQTSSPATAPDQPTQAQQAVPAPQQQHTAATPSLSSPATENAASFQDRLAQEDRGAARQL